MYRFFENLVDPFGGAPSGDTPPNRLGPFTVEYVWPFRWPLFLATVFGLAVALLEVGMIHYAGRVVDLMEGTPPRDFFDAHGAELMLIIAVVLIARPFVQIIDGMLLNQTIMPNIATMVRWRAHRHVLRQSVGWFQNDFAGRIANRVQQTAPAMGEAVFQVFDALVYASVYFVGAALLLGNTDPRLTIPLVLWLVGYAALMAWAIPAVGKHSQAFADARSTITGRIVDAYSNIQTVKLFAHADAEEEFAREAIAHGKTTFARQMRVITTMEIGLVTINGFLVISVIGWAIILWQKGNASVGTVAAASALVLRLNAMTGWIMWALSSLFQNLGVIREGMETIAQPIDLKDASDAPALAMPDGAITFDALSHQYGRDKGGLDGISLQIALGQRVGLVGRSGAGKSTLVNTLLRFHDPEAGKVVIDGQDIKSVSQDSLRRQIGMVTQDTSLLHRSVRENILYGRPDAIEDEMIAAARQVEAHDFILDLEDGEGRIGYDARVGERGVKLSGGQRQRIALARAVLKNAPILVLDEATSALDSEVEAAIQHALVDMMDGKTVIAIAHRLSTIAAMDRIVVMDQGRIVEDGTHTELLARDGLYASFWARQSGGFLGAEAAE